MGDILLLTDYRPEWLRPDGLARRKLNALLRRHISAKAMDCNSKQGHYIRNSRIALQRTTRDLGIITDLLTAAEDEAPNLRRLLPREEARWVFATCPFKTWAAHLKITSLGDYANLNDIEIYTSRAVDDDILRITRVI